MSGTKSPEHGRTHPECRMVPHPISKQRKLARPLQLSFARPRDEIARSQLVLQSLSPLASCLHSELIRRLLHCRSRLWPWCFYKPLSLGASTGTSPQTGRGKSSAIHQRCLLWPAWALLCPKARFAWKYHRRAYSSSRSSLQVFSPSSGRAV